MSESGLTKRGNEMEAVVNPSLMKRQWIGWEEDRGVERKELSFQRKWRAVRERERKVRTEITRSGKYCIVIVIKQGGLGLYLV